MARPVPRRRPDRRHAVRLLALAIVVQVALGVLSVSVLVDDPAPSAPPAVPRARVAPDDPADPSAAFDARARAVRELLRSRTSAVLRGDRAAWLATVDPQAQRFRDRQAAVFDALRSVPLSAWTYQLDERSSAPPDPRLDQRYGRGRWWAPDVVLSHALDGFDERPVPTDQHLTFVRRGARWLVAADDDGALQGRATPRLLWDRGPVVSRRAPGVLVLGRPGAEQLLQQVAARTAEAVPRVTAVWGPWSERVVVVVPSSAEELAALLGTGGELSGIAAVATAELRGGSSSYDPTGHRVMVHPETFPSLSPLGRRIVLTHEVAHVATRAASGPAVPAWLAEGLADHIAYRDVDLPVRSSARALAREVRSGRLPPALPPDEDFSGGSARLSQAYEQSWLVVRMLAETYGNAALLRFYRAVGAERDVSAPVAVERALRAQLGLTPARFTAQWRSALQRQLG